MRAIGYLRGVAAAPFAAVWLLGMVLVGVGGFGAALVGGPARD